jgi:hypothetical protein
VDDGGKIMNLLLYAEARQILEADEPIGAHLTTLPDEFFEELGLFGAVDEKPDEEDFFDRLAQWFSGLEPPVRLSIAV